MKMFARVSWLIAAIAVALIFGLHAASAETRLALVIGNSQYRGITLPTPANDAGLVADALQSAGFTVTGAANLDQETLRESIRQFIEQVSAAGPDAVALVYLSGFGVQFDGDNYYVPVDADIHSATDVPLQAIRVSDFVQPLSALPAKAKIVILDAARQNRFSGGPQPLASGLALVEPVPGMAFAYNAAPGTVGPQEPGPYGAYATALTEMIAAGGLNLDDIFGRVRLRVSELTQGAEIPWYVSQIQAPFLMTELGAGAPPPPNVTPLAGIRGRPLRDFGNADDAYAAALALDTIDGYEQFLALYPNSPYAGRIAAMIAVRREEIIWRRCVTVDTPQAYWSYLRRYPDGPHAWDARRRLEMLRAALAPPPDFAFIDFGVPPPPPAELVFIDRPIIIFAGPGFAPPPRPPLLFLPPRPREFVSLPPPPPPTVRFGLPLPRVAVVPAFVRPPPTVRLPPPSPGAGPNGARPRVPVSLPPAVSHPGAGGAVRPGGPPSGGAPITSPPRRGPPPGAPSVQTQQPPPPHPGSPPAVAKPTTPPPHPGPPPAVAKPTTPPPHPGPPPAVAKPTTPPPHPGPPPAVAKPTTPPPHPGPPPAVAKPTTPPPHPGPAPAVAKPTTPPPHPGPPPAAAKPPAPPPHPGPPAGGAKPPPSCPPGKHPTPQGCK